MADPPPPHARGCVATARAMAAPRRATSDWHDPVGGRPATRTAVAVIAMERPRGRPATPATVSPPPSGPCRSSCHGTGTVAVRCGSDDHNCGGGGGGGGGGGTDDGGGSGGYGSGSLEAGVACVGGWRRRQEALAASWTRTAPRPRARAWPRGAARRGGGRPRARRAGACRRRQVPQPLPLLAATAAASAACRRRCCYRCGCHRGRTPSALRPPWRVVSCLSPAGRGLQARLSGAERVVVGRKVWSGRAAQRGGGLASQLTPRRWRAGEAGWTGRARRVGGTAGGR
ncbi:hypothetical protein I4F81_003799 [Pyropia yezoensis]|uniref:Uncharacterized protein n=1 Tax=Pyropia yezoensis TaxID=2788 RepID=A0ACC3BTY8_PYRYE|nr:hypothetical protein I4F81_003799 [Neopyropia yezoensis]